MSHVQTAVSVDQTQPSDFLTDYSPQDAPWDRHKADTLAMAAAMAEVGYAAHSERMDTCADTLLFGWSDKPDGGSALKLRNAWFCRCRVCPTCQWRRSLQWKARLFQALPSLLGAHPKARWLMLTLTVRNCPVGDLGATLDAMGAAWHRLVKRPEFAPVLGWVRTTEVTRGKDDSAHPHYHVLLFVPSSWFGRNYVTQDRWVELWQSCGRLDYVPVVDVRVVKPNPKRPVPAEGGVPGEVASAAAEVLKYATKPSDLLIDRHEGDQWYDPHVWLYEYIRQVHKRRFVAAGGVLAGVLRERKGDDLVNVGDLDDDTSALPDDGSRLAFGFDRKPKRYRRAPKHDKARMREPGEEG